MRPNPLVGCVLVKGGRAVGEGWHRRFGGRHAEAEALRVAGSAARGATAYVTLEPCSHSGKTPPCADALIAAGIRRVVAALRDPNPMVKGRGIRRLRRAGVRVDAGLLAAQARELNLPFLTRMTRNRPFVILKAAVTLDGKMSTDSGRSKWITSPAARAEGHRLRAAADAVLVGVGTVLADDPSLTSHGKGRNPIRVILDSRGRTPAKAKVRDSSAPTLIYSRGSVPTANGHLDLRAVLKDLAARGVGTLLVEGGPEVHTSFLKARLADEVRIFMAPKLAGGAKARTFFEGAGVAEMADALRLEGLAVRHIGPDLLISGRVANGARKR